jgi:hypothetical protein
MLFVRKRRQQAKSFSARIEVALVHVFWRTSKHRNWASSPECSIQIYQGATTRSDITIGGAHLDCTALYGQFAVLRSVSLAYLFLKGTGYLMLNRFNASVLQTGRIEHDLGHRQTLSSSALPYVGPLLLPLDPSPSSSESLTARSGGGWAAGI